MYSTNSKKALEIWNLVIKVSNKLLFIEENYNHVLKLGKKHWLINVKHYIIMLGLSLICRHNFENNNIIGHNFNGNYSGILGHSQA